MIPQLIQLIPNGASVVGVLIVVILFLRQQDKINMMLETITKGFNEQVNDSQKTFQTQLLKLTTRQFETQRMYQDQLQSLIDAHINVARETIVALKSLEASLKEAKDRGQIRTS
jgi:hypothetical protein